MLQTIALIAGGALFRKFVFRPLTPEEEKILPSYYVRAERINNVIQMVVWGTAWGIAFLVFIAWAVGYFH